MVTASRRSAALAAAVMIAVGPTLAACGGEDEPRPTSTASESAAPSKEKTKSDAKQDKKKSEKTPEADFVGTPVPEVLSEFACAENDKSWQASGVVTNSGKGVVSYQVTVQIGPADGGAQTARTVRLADVAAGSAVAFELEKIPVQGGGPCHVQVLQLDD